MTARDTVLQDAEQKIGQIWGNLNCTGLNFTVSVNVAAPIFYPSGNSPSGEIGPFGNTSATLLNDTSTDNSFNFNVPVTGPIGSFPPSDLGSVHAQKDIFDNAWQLVNGTIGNFTSVDKSSAATEPQPGDLFYGVVERNDGTMQTHAGIVQSYDPAANTLTIIDDFDALRASNGLPSGGAVIGPTTFNLGVPQPPGSGVYIITGDFALYRLTETITGGSAGNTFIDGSTGYQSIIGGSGGNGTIWGGAGDTIQGVAGNVTIGGASGDTITGGTGNYFIDADQGNQSVVGGSAGNGTIWGGSGDTIQGGAGNVTIGGVFGDTITGGSGNEFIDADHGGQSITGGTAGNETIWSGSGDTIHGGAGGNETIGGVVGNTISGGSANTFIDADLGSQSILGGGGNTTVWGGSGDTIQGALTGGNATIAFGSPRTAGHQETLRDNGNSTIASAQSGGNDSVYDFNQAIGDRISLSSADNATTVMMNATLDTNNNTVLHLNDGSSITLVGVTSIGDTFFVTH